MLILVAALFLCALSAAFCWSPEAEGDTVTVTVDGEVYGRYPLSKDREIRLEHNTVVIRDGRVCVSEADCPDQSCVRQGWVRSGVIACLPNRVTVRVDATAEYDVTVGEATP